MGVTAENLTNFPVLVKLTSSNIDYSKTQNNGEDIRFTDTDGSDLAYEIEKWDETGTSFVWVKVPQVDINSSTDYTYMYYGNTSATDHQQASSVWDSSTVSTWHLKETGNGTSGEYKDSTSNANNGQGGGGTSTKTPSLTSSGQINGAQTFDGTDDYIDVGDPSNATLDFGTGDFTISAWVKVNNLGAINREINVISKTTSYVNTPGWFLELSTYGGSATSFAFVFGITNGANFSNHIADTSAVSLFYNTGTWYHVEATRIGTTAKVYVNGVLAVTKTNAEIDDTASNTSSFLFGKQLAWQSIHYPGIIDEVKISSAGRSAAWIAANYHSETDDFNTFASEEQVYSGGSGTLTSSIFDSELSGGAAWGTLTYAATTPSNTSVSVKVRTSNSSSMTGATAFGSCTAISSGSDISSNTCVTDGNRYAQYLITLSNTDSTSTPTFTSYSLTWATYDADAPSISLTALTPDPNSDNTPTLSGTATDTIGTVSNVQFQMDSTSGSWSSCTASDGSFNSASEAFSCTAATLTDGSHTMYVRATDSNGNTTSSSYASDTFTIDATNPVSIDLDSPGDNSYTNSERPTYKWKATTDATAGLSKYVLEIDNPSIGSSQPSGDFTIDNIPTSGTSDITSNNKYVIHFDGFSDSDSTNNYISVYTRSTNDWGSNENDGKLREGRVSWKVKAVDNAGNESSSSRTLFVDRTNPNVEFTQINSTPFTSSNVSTTDKTPTIFGKITDPLAGGDSSQTQSESGPKVASGPKEVNIKVEKKEGLGYKLVTLYKINLDSPYYSCESNNKTIDNSKQKCDKYLPFEYTPKENLDLGTYKITLTGKDRADNGSTSSPQLFINITTLAKITTTEEKKIIEEETKTLKPEEKEQRKQELEITKPTGEVPVSTLEKTGQQISWTSKNILNTTGNLISTVFNEIGNGVRFTVDKTGAALVFVGDKTGQALAFVGRTTSNTLAALYNGTTSILAYIGQGIGNGAKAVGQGLAWTGEKIGQGIGNTGKAIGDGYNQLANNAPGVTKTILTGIGNGVSTATSTIATGVKYTADTTDKFAQNISTIAQNSTKTIGNIASSVASNTSTAIKNVGSAIASATQNGVKATKSGIANIAFAVGEKTQGVAGDFSLALIKFAYNFVPESTKISDVKVAALSPTSVKVSWITNHPANGKVNYGLDRTYPLDVQTEKRVTHHEFTLTNLRPDTTYYFEVMSHNKNYVYDANREFRTPAVVGVSK